MATTTAEQGGFHVFFARKILSDLVVFVVLHSPSKVGARRVVLCREGRGTPGADPAPGHQPTFWIRVLIPVFVCFLRLI